MAAEEVFELTDTPLAGRVALITGGARGQGLSHALAFARAGADVSICDVVSPLPTVPYALAEPAELDQAVAAVEALGARCIGERADVRDLEAMERFAEATAAELGGIDIVVGNAGIYSFAASSWELSAEQWQVMIDVNLTGVWNTCRAAIPFMREREGDRSITLISSVNGFEGVPGTAHYCAAKHGLVGLMRTLAIELAQDGIRVNTLHPTAVDTKLVDNDATPKALESAERYGKDMTNLLPVELMDPVDVSAALVWISSPSSRYVTGITLPIDAGFSVK
ncbi:MAG: mycofactocin-coupled SDR family oxidoreductase [Actinobacteria bacterium]|nr:mycofactocin-coupled SDR family oxidoreductase [Actinomycetota bacterium]